MSLGLKKFDATNGPFSICNQPIGCASTESTPFLGDEEESLAHKLPQQSHSTIEVISPVGAGKSNSFQVCFFVILYFF